MGLQSRPTAPMSHVTTSARGVALILISALGFAAMPLWIKDAYAHGFGPQALVALRFGVVAIVFWAIVVARGGLRRRPPRGAVISAFLLGLTCYALENHLYFAAVDHLDAGIVALVLSIYPALVVGGAIALGRERAQPARMAALALALLGAVLVLSGGAAGALNATGVLLALGSALAYATYLLIGDRLVGALDPFLLLALATSGAAVALTTTALGTGQLVLPAQAAAWQDFAGLVAFSSVLPLAALWCGVRLIGASTAAIVASIEPAATVTLAAVLLGEQLADLQLAGGALVVGAVVLLNARRIERDEPAAEAALATPARTPAPEPA